MDIQHLTLKLKERISAAGISLGVLNMASITIAKVDLLRVKDACVQTARLALILVTSVIEEADHGASSFNRKIKDNK